jgi:hypothetical protein
MAEFRKKPSYLSNPTFNGIDHYLLCYVKGLFRCLLDNFIRRFRLRENKITLLFLFSMVTPCHSR